MTTTTNLTDAQIDQLSAELEHAIDDMEIDRLSTELEHAIDDMESAIGGIRVARGQEDPTELPASQSARLQQAVGEPAGDFLLRFKRAARKEICEEDGFIHDQWTEFQEIAKKDLVKVSAALLAGMGITGAGLLGAVVPVALWIFAALSSIGLSALCDDASG
ncbi:MAG: hypothetical protein LGR52_12275 [Candidatus Thiosymbion ectosymbiont of Robbea hypermnestra]|nr:hypothetical protein [Candidatus Thiosymbion ectosymbiont of Robbea hypermnestra]